MNRLEYLPTTTVGKPTTDNKIEILSTNEEATTPYTLPRKVSGRGIESSKDMVFDQS